MTLHYRRSVITVALVYVFVTDVAYSSAVDLVNEKVEEAAA